MIYNFFRKVLCLVLICSALICVGVGKVWSMDEKMSEESIVGLIFVDKHFNYLLVENVLPQYIKHVFEKYSFREICEAARCLIKLRLVNTNLNKLLTDVNVRNILIYAGADLSILNKVFNQDGDTPLHSVVELGSVSLARLLVLCGADVNIQIKKKGWSEAQTPLFIAVALSNGCMARFLISAGASICLCDSQGMTPLALAQSQQNDVMVLLLNCTLGCENNSGSQVQALQNHI